MKHAYRRHIAALLTALLSCSLLASCGTSTSTSGATPTPEAQGEQVELVVFAAASMTESLTEIQQMYKTVAPNVKLQFNFDSSGTLKTQIQEGAVADVFISAGQKQMYQLDIAADKSVNTEGLDLVASDTRFDLLTNTVVMIVPKGSEKGITSFADAGTDKVKLMALGNSDVPVGQYSQEIFTYLNLWDKLNSEKKITFGSNVKEVLAQVEEAAVDCGVVCRYGQKRRGGCQCAGRQP